MELRCRFLCLKINIFNRLAKELKKKKISSKQFRHQRILGTPGNSQTLISVQPRFSHPDQSPPKRAQSYELDLQHVQEMLSVTQMTGKSHQEMARGVGRPVLEKSQAAGGRRGRVNQEAGRQR